MTLISGARVGGDKRVGRVVVSMLFLFKTAIMHVGGVFVYLAC